MGRYRVGSDASPEPLKMLTTTACFQSCGMVPVFQQWLRCASRVLVFSSSRYWSSSLVTRSGPSALFLLSCDMACCSSCSVKFVVG